MLHLNHAGASLLPQPVLDAVIDHLQREAHTGGYEAAGEADRRSSTPTTPWPRSSGARADGDRPHGLGHPLVGPRDALARRSSPRTGSCISRAEYGSNAIALLQLQRRTGCQLVLVDDDEHGQIDLDALERGARRRTTRPSCPSSTCPRRAAW